MNGALIAYLVKKGDYNIHGGKKNALMRMNIIPYFSANVYKDVLKSIAHNERSEDVTNKIIQHIQNDTVLHLVLEYSYTKINVVLLNFTKTIKDFLFNNHNINTLKSGGVFRAIKDYYYTDNLPDIIVNIAKLRPLSDSEYVSAVDMYVLMIKDVDDNKDWEYCLLIYMKYEDYLNDAHSNEQVTSIINSAYNIVLLLLITLYVNGYNDTLRLCTLDNVIDSILRLAAHNLNNHRKFIILVYNEIYDDELLDMMLSMGIPYDVITSNIL